LQLTQLWQDLLGQPRVGVTDNFFDLGGHSLLAVRLLAQIRKRTGQELPLATLIEAGTVERLSAVLQRQGAGQQSPLVPIQPRGTRPPFFCVHPGSGNVLCYLALAQHVGAEQPFYGLQDPNTLDSHEKQSQADFEVPMEIMAGRYVEAIRRVQPRGPYHLGGWSFGGFVAYEMAQQLRRAGEEVALLAVLDTGPVFEKLGRADDADLFAILCEESGLTIDVEELRPLGPAAQLNYVVEHLKAAQRIPADIPVSWVARSINIFKARIRVTMAYELQPYAGQITLFRAAELDSDVSQADETMGWRRLTTHPVEVHVVPGSHATMGREPHVAVLADKLRACLVREAYEAAIQR
jgi:thioesterase domain-containing protein/aryl carrier-like protein